jgi:hypothetical protein
MDDRRKKLLVAAAAAVYRYLRSQEEQQQLAMAAAAQRTIGPAAAMVSLWSASGRQAAMEMRRLFQMRIIR